jgi:hypothetical protein
MRYRNAVPRTSLSRTWRLLMSFVAIAAESLPRVGA